MSLEPTDWRPAAPCSPSPPAAPAAAASAASAAVRCRLSPWELREVRADALREYALLRNRLAVDDLLRAESLSRADLAADAASLLSAVAARCRDERARAAQRVGRAARLLSGRLEGRAAAAERSADAREAALREGGRAAWRAEVAEAERCSRAAEERRVAELRADNALRAACAFVAGAETRARRDLDAEESAARVQLSAVGEEGRVDAERRAHERFLATPEQVALREERERREAAQAKATARQLQRFVKEQKALVEGCTHARGRTSMFEGPQAKRLCVSCAVKFDNTLGYFVRMRGNTIKPPAGAALPPPPVALPPIEHRTSATGSLPRKKK